MVPGVAVPVAAGAGPRAPATTLTPSAARASAIARPMPLLAPVTTAVLPVRCRSMVAPRRLDGLGRVRGRVDAERPGPDRAATPTHSRAVPAVDRLPRTSSPCHHV